MEVKEDAVFDSVEDNSSIRQDAELDGKTNAFSRLKGKILTEMLLRNLPAPGSPPPPQVPIACRHLFPRQLSEHGIPEERVELTDTSVKFIISRQAADQNSTFYQV